MNDETLKIDLCARLPYGVKVEYDDRIGKIVQMYLPAGKYKIDEMVFSLEEDEKESELSCSTKYWNCKPILFNSLTEPITISGETFVPIVELAKIAESQYFNDNSLNIKSEKNVHGCSWLSKDGIAFAFSFFSDSKSFYLCNENNDKLYINNMSKLFDKLNEWHINYRLSSDQFIPATNEYA